MKCPYCFRLLGTWHKDPILLPDGSKYKWSNSEETTLEEVTDIVQRDYKGMYQISEEVVIELQEQLKTLESDNAITPLTEFSPLNTSGKFQITGKHIKEMRDSVEKILEQLGLTKTDYFNYDEENNHIIRPNGDKIEWTDPIVESTDLQKFQVKNIHIEDLRHYISEIWQETWDGGTVFEETSLLFGTGVEYLTEVKLLPNQYDHLWDYSIIENYIDAYGNNYAYSWIKTNLLEETYNDKYISVELEGIINCNEVYYPPGVRSIVEYNISVNIKCRQNMKFIIEDGIFETTGVGDPGSIEAGSYLYIFVFINGKYLNYVCNPLILKNFGYIPIGINISSLSDFDRNLRVDYETQYGGVTDEQWKSFTITRVHFSINGLCNVYHAALGLGASFSTLFEINTIKFPIEANP